MSVLRPGTPPPIPAEALRPMGQRGRSVGSDRAPRAEAVTARTRQLPPPIPEECLRARVTLEDLSPAVEALPPPPPPEALRRSKRGSDGQPVTVESLVERARGGDRRAFAALVQRFRPRILALALHLTGSASDAEDVTQDTFLRAFERLSTFEGRSAFFTWLYRIALNRALQSRQRRRQRPSVDLDDPRVALAVVVDAVGSPARALELRETYAQLVYAFDRLSPLMRTTVALITLQGLTHPEAAVVLETTEGTVAWRMHEARAQLRRSLDQLAEKSADEASADRSGARRALRQREEEGSEALSVQLAMALCLVVG